MKKHFSLIIALLLLLTGLTSPISELASPGVSYAAATPRLSYSSVELRGEGAAADVKISGVKASGIKKLVVTSKNDTVASALVLSKNRFRVIAISTGSTTVNVKVTLKKAVKKKKTFSLKLKVTTKVQKDNEDTDDNPGSTEDESTAPQESQDDQTKPEVTESLPDESTVYSRIMAMKETYPQGTPWTNDNVYKWKAFKEYSYMEAHGCVAFACILSDAAFGKTLEAKEITNPDASTIRVGDIIRINGDTHSAMVIGTDGDSFTLAEGNVNESVYWGRTIPKSTPINYVWTRW